MAGGWQPGANLRQVVVFRRGPDWRLMATMLDLRGALYGRRPVPADDIWLNDSDTVLLPKTPIQQADEFIEQVFTRGIYGVVPIEKVWNSAGNPPRPSPEALGVPPKYSANSRARSLVWALVAISLSCRV
jgi:hypothetical protein